MFSFVQRLPTDLGRTFIAARQGQASNKAKQTRSMTDEQMKDRTPHLRMKGSCSPA